MQRIIIDTNVLVSGLIQQSFPYLILNDLFIERKIELCISDELIKEYFDFMHRKKFSKYPEFHLKAKLVLADIETKAMKFVPKTKVKNINDESDNKLLELADENKAKSTSPTPAAGNVICGDQQQAVACAHEQRSRGGDPRLRGRAPGSGFGL